MSNYILKPKLLFLAGDLGAVFFGYWISLIFNKTIQHSFGFAVLLVLFSLTANAFTDDYKSIDVRGYIKETRYSLFFAMETTVVYILLLIANKNQYTLSDNHLELLYLVELCLVLFFCVYSTRRSIKVYNRKFNVNKTPVLLARHLSQKSNVEAMLEGGYLVKGYINFGTEQESLRNLPILKNIKELRSFISQNNIDEIFITYDSYEEFKRFFEPLKTLGIKINVDIDTFSPLFVGNISVTKLGNETFLSSSIRVDNIRDTVIKRLMDICGGLVGTMLMLVVAALIYPKVQKESKGPLFFKQKRVGKNGKVFYMYKFRSMYLDAEERKHELMAKNDLNTNLMFKMKDDPRIFPFGQKLRDWSLDELPQFINVLRGEMSLVGTRPPTVDEYRQYEMHHFKRLSMKPGITGLWQVSGRSDIDDFEEVVALDLQYIQNWSIDMDIKILFKTIKVVLKKEGSR